jgi:Phytanoyl-CoA dioxygenase (PhyH)
LTALADLTVPAPEPGPADWNDEGVVVLPGLIPDALIGPYEAAWWEANGSPEPLPTLTPGRRIGGAWSPGGWAHCTPYREVEALRALVCHADLASAIEALLGEPAGVHLNLTGWVTTQRDWHQDTYLNPPHVGDFYAAAWIALGDIHPDSGPFQYVPGSHRWPTVTRDLIGAHVDLSDPRWPAHSEEVLSPLFDQEIAERGAEVVTYLPKRGDVLVWHGRLVHRGTRARVPGSYRPALIAHYSGVNHRSDMPAAVPEGEAGWLFPIEERVPVR